MAQGKIELKLSVWMILKYFNTKTIPWLILLHAGNPQTSWLPARDSYVDPYHNPLSLVTSEIPYGNPDVYVTVFTVELKTWTLRNVLGGQKKKLSVNWKALLWVDRPTQDDIAIVMPLKFKCITEAI